MTTAASQRRPARKGEPTPRQSGWRTRDIFRTTLIVAGVYLALQALWLGRTVFLLGFFGVLLGLALSSGVDRLQRYRIPRGVGAALLVLTMIAALVGLGFLTAPQIGGQMREVQDQLPQAVDEVRGWVQRRIGGITEIFQPDSTQASSGRSASGGKGEQEPAPAPAVGQGLTQQLSSAGRAFFTVFSSTLSALAGLIVLVFVAIFVASEPDLYHRGLMHLFPHEIRSKAGEILSATATTLRRWLVMQLLAMVAIGVVSTLALLALGVRGAIALGIIAGILEFIPYMGPILSAVPAVGMALLDGPEKALYVVLAYTAIQQLEALVLQPLLMKEGLEVPPVITILSQGLLATLFGFLGLLLAVPLVASVMIPVKMLYVRDVVGDEVSVPGEDAD
jgi:predicted PurR-regulated permease PerM